MSEREASWIAAGLYDPASPRAAERLQLLRWIEASGVTLAEMVAANAIGQLGAVVGDHQLRPGPQLTTAEIAAAVGLDEESVAAIRKASGLPQAGPDDRVYVEDDIDMLRAFQGALHVFSPGELVHFTRVVGSALRRIAEAAGEMFLRDVEVPMQAHATELEWAQAQVAGIQLARTASAVFDPMFRAHLEMATRTTREARVGLHDSDPLPLSIAFVDLNGFTSRTGETTSEELLELVMAFEATAIDLVSEHGGRLIKLIGDEVMFSTVAPDTACRIASELIEHAGVWVTTARGGIAYGPVVASGGDVYGETVNLASRIADIAVPGELLVNEAVVSGAPNLAFEPAGRRQLKGFATATRLWSLTVA